MKHILSAGIGIVLFPFVFLHYLIIGRKPDIWLFGAWRGNKYSDNSKALYEYVLHHAKDIHPVWITRNPEVYKELKGRGYPVVMNSSIKAIYYMLRGGFCCGPLSATTDVFGSKSWLGYGIKALYLTHGMPSKHSGYDEPKMKHKKALTEGQQPLWLQLYFRMFPQKNPHNLYTISTSDFFVPFLESCTLTPGENIFVTGTPRLDTLFSPEKDPYIAEIRRKFPTAKIIIYMPTFRDSYDGGESFKPFEQFGFDQEKFIQVLEDLDYVFLNKGHYWDGVLADKEYSDRFINVVDSPMLDVYSMIKDADILMTDYSSIYFDFLPLLKPAILTPFDFDTFIKDKRGYYFDYRKELPSIKAYNWDEVCDILEQKKYFPLTEEQTRKFHQYIDGESSQRLTQKIKGILHLNS